MTTWHESTVCADVSELFDKADQGANMSKTITTTLYLYQTPHGTVEDPSFYLTQSANMESEGWALMREVPVTVDLPEPMDVRKIKLSYLELKEKQARAEFSALIVELQRQKNELLAIEMEAA